MAKLFDIRESKILPNEDIIAIPAMKKIWDRDKTRGKEKAMKEYSYMVFLVDFHSPYKDLSEDEKETTIIKDVFKEDKWQPDQAIKDAIEKYKELQDTRHLKMLRSYEHIEDQITKYNMNIDLTATDDFGKPKYNMNDIQRSAKEIGSIVKSISILEKQVELEISESNVRGQSKVGHYEK